jgi:hypothetical protein
METDMEDMDMDNVKDIIQRTKSVGSVAIILNKNKSPHMAWFPVETFGPMMATFS